MQGARWRKATTYRWTKDMADDLALMDRLGPHGNARFTSVVPPGADVGGTPGERLRLNIPLEFGRGNLKKFRIFGQGSIQ